MATGVFSWINRADTAAISSGTFAAGLPPVNVQDTIIANVWRATATVFSVDVDFGRDVDIDVLAFAQPTDGSVMHPTDEVRHRLDIDGGTPGAGAVYDSGWFDGGVTSGFGYHGHVLADTVTARHWRMEVDAYSLTTEGYVDIGRLWAGPVWRPALNFSFGWLRRWHAGGRATHIGTRSLIQYPEDGARAREFDIPFPQMKDSDPDTAEDFIRYVGRAKQWLMVLDPDAPERTTALCRFTSALDIIEQNFGTFEVNLTALESR